MVFAVLRFAAARAMALLQGWRSARSARGLAGNNVLPFEFKRLKPHAFEPSEHPDSIQEHIT